MMRNCPRIGWAALVVVAASIVGAAPATAEAQTRIGTPFAGTRPLQLDLHAGLVWRKKGRFATGVRFGIPIVHNGFVPSINNAVYINFGGDLYFKKDDLDLGIPVTMHWEFYFTESWSAFGEAGLNIYLDLDDNEDFDPIDWFIAQVGGRFWFNEALAITLRVGSPYVSFGVSFFF